MKLAQGEAPATAAEERVLAWVDQILEEYRDALGAFYPDLPNRCALRQVQPHPRGVRVLRKPELLS